MQPQFTSRITNRTGLAACVYPRAASAHRVVQGKKSSSARTGSLMSSRKCLSSEVNSLPFPKALHTHFVSEWSPEKRPPDSAPCGAYRRAHGFQFSSSRLRPPDISNACFRLTRDVRRDRVEDLRSSGDQNCASTQPEPNGDTGGISIASRNLPALTSPNISLSLSISSSTDSSQASHPQTGKGSLYHRPSLIRSPGNWVNTMAIGADSGSVGMSFTPGRARSIPLSSSSSRPYPSVRSTS